MTQSIWYQHEALDRIHSIQEMISVLLVDHPGIQEKKHQKLISKARSTLAQLYQSVGEWEAPCELCGEEEAYTTYSFCERHKQTLDIMKRDLQP